MPETFQGNERFAIRERLGAGTFGVVYAVEDRQRSSTVALKTLQHTLPEALYRFKREFRALADLVHPNLVTLHELHVENGCWFFTMELVDGGGLLGWIRQDGETASADTMASGEALEKTLQLPSRVAEAPSWDRVRDGFWQLARGVYALHQRGYLHRDIKPGNVRVTREGRVVLLDFGLVTPTAEDGEARSVGLVGTPAYMAPEQAAGQITCEASDWYAVGVLLYECLTGRLPYEGKPLTLLLAKQEQAAPPIGSLVSGVPEDLETLCTALLHRDADTRPGGEEVLRRLDQLRTEPHAAPVALRPELREPFVGRVPELHGLRAAYEETHGGRPVLAHVTGPSGIGKSRLVLELLNELARTGAVILRGRCFQQERVPFKGVDGAVDELSRYLAGLPQSEAEAALPLDVDALTQLFPVLLQVTAISGRRQRLEEISDPIKLRTRALRALKELLARIAVRRPLVVFIDDLQWGDDDSGLLLGEILRPPARPAMLLLAAYRSEEADHSPLLRRLRVELDGLDDPVVEREVTLAPLQQEIANRLAEALLGTERQSEAERVAKESAGSPFFLGELAHAVKTADSAELVQVAEASLDQVLARRLDGLPGSHRRFLEVLAVAGGPLDLALVAGCADVTSDREAVVAELRAGRLIRNWAGADNDQVETYHDRIREVVVESLDPARRQGHHLQLADRLEAQEDADPELLVTHLVAAGERVRAATHAARAARQAAEGLAFDRAARLYRQALELSEARETNRLELLIGLADSLTNSGRVGEAGQVYLDGARLASGDQALQLRIRTAEQLMFAGHLDEGLPVLRQLAEDVGLTFPSSHATAIARILYWDTRLRLRGLGYEERDEARADRSLLRKIQVAGAIGISYYRLDGIYAHYFIYQATLLALESGVSFWVGALLAALGPGRVVLGLGRGDDMMETGEAILRRSVDDLDTRYYRPVSAPLTLMRGHLPMYNAAFKEAAVAYDQAETAMLEAPRTDSASLASAIIMRNQARVPLGQIRALVTELPDAVATAERYGAIIGAVSLVLSGGAWPGLAADDPHRAEQYLKTYPTRWRHGRGGYIQEFYQAFSMGAVELYQGRSRRAMELSDRVYTKFQRIALYRYMYSSLLLDFWRLGARIQLLTFEAPGDRRLLRQTNKLLQELGRRKLAPCRPLATHFQGCLAAATGDRGRAIALLADAEPELRALGWQMFVQAGNRLRGQLLGGTDGEALKDAADAFMASEQIHNPARFAALFAPGGSLPD